MSARRRTGAVPSDGDTAGTRRVEHVGDHFGPFDVFHSIKEVQYEWGTIDVVAFDADDDRVVV